MTFREKLAKERPNMVNPRVLGGCYGCPKGYGYETKKPDYCKCGTEKECTKCWNREMPGTEEKTEKPEVNNIPVDMAALGAFIKEINSLLGFLLAVILCVSVVFVFELTLFIIISPALGG
jgi:hypothetical protein